MKLLSLAMLCWMLAGCAEVHEPAGFDPSRSTQERGLESAVGTDGYQDAGSAPNQTAPDTTELAEPPPSHVARSEELEEPPVVGGDAGIFEPDDSFAGTQCQFDVDRERLTLTVPSPDYPTIQSAIDAAEPLDTVRVLSGTYYEHLVLRPGVRLVGSGRDNTILDGQGLAVNLIDFSYAHDVVVSGFTLRNVGQAEGCAAPEDPLRCSGNWYASAVYADGHSVWDDSDACNDPSIDFHDNIVADNQIGMMLYFWPYAAVRDNVFVGNRTGFSATSHGGASSLLAHNIFYDNTDQAIAADASFLDIVDNVFVENGTVLVQDYCQEGIIRCNVAWNNGALGERFVLDQGDNIAVDPRLVRSGSGFALAPDSPALQRACASEPAPRDSDDSCVR